MTIVMKRTLGSSGAIWQIGYTSSVLTGCCTRKNRFGGAAGAQNMLLRLSRVGGEDTAVELVMAMDTHRDDLLYFRTFAERDKSRKKAEGHE